MRRVNPPVLACMLALAGALILPAASLQANDVKADAASDLPFHYQAKGKRDPFVPLVRDGQLVPITQSVVVESSVPVLHGIMWDPYGQSIALINDLEAKVGDPVGEYQVLEIRHDAVVLSSGGEPVVLQINFESPPAPPSTSLGGERR